MQFNTLFLCLAGPVAAMAATTTVTVTVPRSDCTAPGDSSAGASLRSSSMSMTVPPACSATDCGAAASAVPTCAQSCLSSVAEEYGCSDGDAVCSCDYISLIQTAATSCVASACPVSQYQAVSSSVAGLCSCASAFASATASCATAGIDSAGAGQRSSTESSMMSINTESSGTDSSTSSTDTSTPASDSEGATAISNSATQSDSSSSSDSDSNTATSSVTSTSTSSSVDSTGTPSGSDGATSCYFSTTNTDGYTIPPTATAQATTYSYVGCFAETNDYRAVSGVDYNGTYDNVNECAALCAGSGASYLSVEYYGECFCGNSLNDTAGCSTGCTYSCFADDGNICGGDYAAQVYQLQS